ncbi:MAG: hypothetical protein IKV40_03140, partial [Clostridia bacterium]|nr:hypothetical protein [Clostridia bacterium]
PEQVIPPSVTTVKFSTIEELIEKFGNEIDAFAPGYYARQEFLEAVDKFIDPAAHQDSMTKSEYAALAGMKLQDISATYDRSSGKMYLTFTVTGEPVGSLKKGKNTAEICENAYEGMGVMCGDTSGNNANEARSAVSKYIRWLGNDGMPENTWSGSYNFTDYMASCLNDIGKTPTRDLIVDYAARCFGLEGYSPLPSQFDASGNHVQLGYGLGVVNFIITGDKVEGVVHTVTVDIYRSSFYYDKYQTLNFHLTKLSDGAWKFIDITVAADGNEGVFESILANQTPIYLATSKKEKLLSEFLDGTVYSLKKYTILDLDGDGRVEMVLWIVRYTNDYVGFLVLHREGDVVYAHELPYRGMTGLKSDGTFSFSSGAADSGIGKIEFSGDTFSVIKLAYSESEMTKNTRYYIDDKPVSQESFDAYWDSHSLFKLDAEWIEYDGGGGTVTTFSTVDELVAAYGETEILDRVLYGGAYSIDDLRFAVNSFLDPRKYREEIGETKYYARDGLGIKDPTLTYDRENGKIYLNFTAVGEPIGTLKLGENTCAVQVGVNGIYVACGEWIAVDTDAKATLSRYLSSTGIYGMPDITNSSDKSGLTRYMIQSLTETGIIPTKNAIQDYARECFYLENFDPGDWPVVNGVYQEPAMGGLDFPYLIVDEVEEGVIHYVTAHFYTDYSYEVIEREVTFILYDLGVKKFRFEGATEWKINGTNITVDVDNLATTMEIVEHAEMYPAEEYTVYVTGLSTPVTLFMRRDSVYKIEAFGHYLTTSEPHDMYGNCHHALFEVDGAIIFTWSYYSIGSNYIFTSKGCGQFDPAREDVSFLLYLDYMGNFKYRFTNKNEADIQQAVMYYVTTYNEFYYEVGDASIVDGTVVLGEIKEYNTIGEVYSLDGMFAKGKEDG